ncbi:MAG: glycerophosphodiester phosphodiesterase [Planctomycetota bacterium]
MLYEVKKHKSIRKGSLLVSDVREVAQSLKGSWKSLVAADLVFKALAFCVLTPLFVAFWRGLLLFRGEGALSDVDVAKFFAGPFGWCCAIVMGASWLAIIAMEQASLLFILACKSNGHNADVPKAIRFALSHAQHIFAVAARFIGFTLLAVAPFLLVAVGVYFGLLRDYDINYYLNEKPFEFKTAVGIGCVLGLVLTAILVRMYSAWVLALPLVLFGETSSKQVLSASREAVQGDRKRVVKWLVTWLVFILIANAMLGGLVRVLGNVLLPESIGSIALLVTRVGALLILTALGGIAIHLLSSIAFAGVLFHGYRTLGLEADDRITSELGRWSIGDSSGFRVVTKSRIMVCLIVATLGAVLLGYSSLRSLRLADSTEVMAHRGASSVAPENTMAAFEQAIEDGADWIEIDVQEIADGTVVVAHDSDFMKLSQNPLKIWDAAPSDLADLDIGSWFSKDFADERVPTLEEVLRLCRGRVKVNIELKYYGHDQQLEQSVVDIVEAEKMADQVMVMSLKPEAIAKVKALRPNWRCGLLLSVYVGNMKNIEADFLAVNSKFATRSFVQRAHRLGKEVYVWTVNDAATMSQVLNRQVDGILTDRPDLARQVLAERAEMSTAERLLAEIALLFNRPTEVPSS